MVLLSRWHLTEGVGCHAAGTLGVTDNCRDVVSTRSGPASMSHQCLPVGGLPHRVCSCRVGWLAGGGAWHVVGVAVGVGGQT
jgi:hypothetical protein